ncbi:hypothetical protein EV401DRAFT_1894736 [Pisolithus croceorrhizus]|nr:hypothetical protein EV401DRAFT_1894736 [Pisolithus croceorrhizus]
MKEKGLEGLLNIEFSVGDSMNLEDNADSTRQHLGLHRKWLLEIESPLCDIYFEHTLRVLFGTVPSVAESLLRLPTGTFNIIVVESLLRLPTALFNSYWIIRRMDYLPELAHNGHNWTTYASLVLCAISDEGLMGFLVGSERRPTHPAELIGRGEGWTPQTDDERAEVAAWRAADQLWTQRNAMVNYTIVSGIPDTIFGFMLHLKSPLEKWDYLEKRFGSIPRPESWLVAEEVERRSDSNVAAETGQDTHNGDESRDLPGSQNEPTDSPNDHAETESEYLTLETEVIDVRHEEPYLLVVEVGTMDSKQLDEGTNALEAPDEGSQCTGDKVEEDEDLPTSSEALEPQGNLPFTTSERAETRTGHRKPENEVADMRHVVDVLPMFEVGSTGQAWYDKHVKELQAPDEGGRRASDEVEESRDLPKSSSDVLEPEVVDVRHMELHLPVVEVGTGDLKQRLDEHANALEAPDKRCQCMDNEPADNISGQASGHSMQDRPQVPTKDNQRSRTNSETIANIPDPPNTPTKLPTPQVEHSRLWNSPSARAHSATSMETNLSCTGRSSKRRETKRLELDCKQALGRPKRTYQGCSTSETPPDEAQGMGVYSSAGVGWGDSTTTGSIMTTLEIRGLSARTVETRVHLPHWDTTRKEPDKAGDTGGRGDDTASKDFVDLRGVEKTLLAISRSQQGEREAKWRNGLPVPPETPPNGYLHRPGTIGDPHQHGGMKTRVEKVRRARRIKMRGRTHRCDHIHGSLAISNPNEVSRHLRDVANTYQHQGVPPRSIQSSSRPMNDRAAAWQTQYKEKRAGGSPGSPITPVPPPTGTYYNPKSFKGLRHRARFKSNAENESRQAEWSMAIRNLAIWDNLSGKEDNGSGRHGKSAQRI